MKKHTKKQQKASFQVASRIASSTMAFTLLACVAIAGDSLFADTHVAMYGALPSVSSSDYTPVQKSSLSSQGNAAARRAVARKASALTHGAASATASSRSSSNSSVSMFPSVDGSTCVEGAVGGCNDLVNALATVGNPACLLNTNCKQIVANAGGTRECYSNLTCRRAYAMYIFYNYQFPKCIEKPTLCTTELKQLLKGMEGA